MQKLIPYMKSATPAIFYKVANMLMIPLNILNFIIHLADINDHNNQIYEDIKIKIDNLKQTFDNLNQTCQELNQTCQESNQYFQELNDSIVNLNQHMFQYGILLGNIDEGNNDN